MLMGPEVFHWDVALLLFLLYIGFDFLYALYYIFVGKKKAFLAACTAVAMYLMSAFGILSFFKNPWYICAIAAGSFVGTYVAVRYFSDKIK